MFIFFEKNIRLAVWIRMPSWSTSTWRYCMVVLVGNKTSASGQEMVSGRHTARSHFGWTARLHCTARYLVSNCNKQHYSAQLFNLSCTAHALDVMMCTATVYKSATHPSAVQCTDFKCTQCRWVSNAHLDHGTSTGFIFHVLPLFATFACYVYFHFTTIFYQLINLTILPYFGTPFM